MKSNAMVARMMMVDRRNKYKNYRLTENGKAKELERIKAKELRSKSTNKK
jgi:uncharacterized protein (DUF39 family)